MNPFHADPPYSDLDRRSLPLDSFDPYGPSSPHFPPTPSYAGSYQNSPYSGVSELDFGDGKDDALGFFNDDDPLAVDPADDYDPAAYDAPASSGLLIFHDDFMAAADNPADHLSLSVSHDHPLYDHGSPASSNGAADSGNEDYRSPASSVSSSHHHRTVTHSLPSPRLNFEGLHVDSPYLPARQIPTERAGTPSKPPSPPCPLSPSSECKPDLKVIVTEK